MIPDLLRRNLNWIKELYPEYGKELEPIFETHSFIEIDKFKDRTAFSVVIFECKECGIQAAATPNLRENPWSGRNITEAKRWAFGYTMTCNERIIKSIIE
jgi:hypothetical protein